MIKVQTPAGEVEVTTKEQAIRIIQNTAHVEGFTKSEQLASVQPILNLATYFGVNLNHFKRVCETDINSHHMGYGPHAIQYTEGENNWQYFPTVIFILSEEWEETSSNSSITENFYQYVLEHITSLPEESKSTIQVERSTDKMSIQMRDIITAINDNPITVFTFNDEETMNTILWEMRSSVLDAYFNSNLAVIKYIEELEQAEISITSKIGLNPYMQELNLIGKYLDVAPFIQQAYEG